MAFMPGDYYGAGLADGSSGGTSYTSESYHTALDIFQMSNYSSSSGTFKSTIDPALVYNDVSTTDDLRLVFSKIDISQELFDVSHIVVGQGGYSDVVRGNLRTVRDTLMVAIKKPRALRRDTAFLKKLAREIAIWNNVSHRNILPLWGLAWIENDIPAMVSPWCRHGNIMEFLAQKRDDQHLMSVICRLLRDVLEGLGHLHDIKIMHGDLKGANVLISDDGVARVGDFGMSVVLAQYPGQDASTFGTLRWTAPDLFREDSQPLTPECDIWSFGCVVLEVVSNTKPHYTIEEDRKVFIALGRNLAPARPPNFPDPVWQLCHDCFLVEPQQRPSTRQLLGSMAQLETLYGVDDYPIGDDLESQSIWSIGDNPSSFFTGTLPNGSVSSLQPSVLSASSSVVQPRQPKKFALLIGIEYIPRKGRVSSPYRLRLPHTDMEELRRVLVNVHDFRDSDITVMIDSPACIAILQPTKQNIIRELVRLVKSAKRGDKLVFAYSGNIKEIPTPDPTEESGRDQYIEPMYAEHWGNIRDNLLHKILVKNLPPGVTLFAIFDASSSGTILDLQHNWDWNGNEGVVGPRTFPVPSVFDGIVDRVRPPASEVLCFSAARDGGVAWERRSRGESSYLRLFVEAMRQPTSGTIESIFVDLAQGTQAIVPRGVHVQGLQRPQFSSNNSRLDIRKPFSTFL